MVKQYIVVFGSLAALGVAACSSSTATPPGQQMTGGGAGGSGNVPVGGAGNVANTGNVPMGGSGNTGNVPSTGNTGNVPSGGSGSGGAPALTGTTVVGCPGGMTQPEDLVNSLPVCDQCANAVCVPNSLVPEGQVDLLAACDANSMCVPIPYAILNGEFKAQNCTSLGGAEGRCVSVCVPQVAQQADQLPQDNCAQGELCAPCYNPIDGVETGACSVGCSDPPTEAPYVFASCGAGLGVCVPESLVPANLIDAVPIDTCQPGELCAPIEKARDLNAKFVSCPPAALGLPPDPAQPGACVPQYIADANPSGALVSDAGQCADDPGDPGAGYICVPCVNPLDQVPTGACE